MTIFTSNPLEQYRSHSLEIDSAVMKCLQTGDYILGQAVHEFELNFAKYLGSSYCVGVNSGTDALIISLRALGIQRGDEVATTSLTAVATISAIVAIGAIPVFVDISRSNYNISIEEIESTIKKRNLKAIIIVHLHGNPNDMESIMAIARRHSIKVIEDCAQAHGASWNNKKIGTYGDISAFSFYPTKNLGAMGDAGAIVTSNQHYFEQSLLLRQYGWNDNRESVISSNVSRMDSIQAVILSVKLKYLDSDNEKRATNAQRYENNLRSSGFLLPSKDFLGKHVFHQYVIQTDFRDILIQSLQVKGINLSIHYQIPAHKHKAFQIYHNATVDNTLENTESTCNKILSLPMYPELANDAIDFVSESLITTKREILQ